MVTVSRKVTSDTSNKMKRRGQVSYMKYERMETVC